MTTTRLAVHRALNEIGGCCIETGFAGHRLILDFGRPLDAPEGLADGLVPITLDTTAPVVLLSHAHQDHGVLRQLRSGWPVYCGAAGEKLIRLTGGIFGGVPH